ncbi:MAG TPA: hypothetical protein VFH51_07780, partial [Myxococcota bacterium]|nr:hypothetical protein [Myxococcota bacterium]
MQRFGGLPSLLVRLALGLSLGACGEPSTANLENARALQLAASNFQPEIGKGVNAAETQTFAKCVVFPPVGEQTVGFQSRLYDEYSVSSRQELDSKLDISASVSARGMWGDAAVGAGFFKNLEFTEDAFYWLVDARYVLQHESIDTSSAAFQLSDLGKRLLQQRGIVGFTRACGTHFYVGRTLGARYNLVYEFRSREDKFVERIRASARYSGFGVGAETELDKFLAIAKKSAYVRIHSGIEGGGFSIADYANDAATLKAELTRLREDLLVHRQGDVLNWEMSSYDIFPEIQEAKEAAGVVNLDDDYKREALALYYRQYTANKAAMAHIDALLARAGGPEPWVVYSAATQGHLAQTRDMLAAQNDAIAGRAGACLRNPDAACETRGLTPIRVEDPTPERDLSGLGTWSLYPVLRQGSSAIVDFYGSPGDAFNGRFFDTGEHLFSSPAGAFVMASNGSGRRYPLLVGTFDMQTSEQGSTRPKICVDEFADVCNLRVVENINFREGDGYP